MLSGHEINLNEVHSVEGWVGAVNKVSINPDSNTSNFNIATDYQVRDALQNMNKVFLELQTEQGILLQKTNEDTLVLTPGTYKITNGWNVGNQRIVLEGFPEDLFVFDVVGDLTLSNSTIMSIGGIRPRNILWAVTNNVSIGANSQFFGTILSQQNITINQEVLGTYALMANGDIRVTRSDGIVAPAFLGGDGNGEGETGITGNWNLLGNAGTNAGNFLGTTDVQNLTIKTNNVPRMIFGADYGIQSNEFLGIGKWPSEHLDVNGAIRIGSDVNNYINPKGGTIKYENNNFYGYRNGDNVSYPGAWHPLGSQWSESANALYYNTKQVQIGNLFVDLATSYAPSLKVAGKAFIGSSNNNITIGTGGDYAENTMIESNGGSGLLINYYSGNGLFVGGTLSVGKTYGGTGTGNLFVAGKVGIGTKNPDQALTVKGAIHAESVKVDLSVPFPDFVFDEEYKLMSLEDLKLFIQSNKHLPNIPSQSEVEKLKVIDLGVMNSKLLEKVEELTLYILEQQKELDEIKKQIQKPHEK